MPTGPNFDNYVGLRRKLEETQAKLGMNQRELARKLGISAPYLNEIMTGRKSGRRKLIDFARRLDLSVEQLTGTQLSIPLLAEVTATGPFRCDESHYIDIIDIGRLPGISKQTAQNYYALRVRDNSMTPFLKHGDVLIVEKNSWERIRPCDKVVLKQRKLCYIRYMELMGEPLILRPLNFGLPLQPEPRTILAHLEKVVYIIAC